MKCKYEGSGAWAGRCLGTMEIDPCVGIKNCDRYKPGCLTNADRIRAMSDEGLADLFSEIADEGLSCTLICTNYDKCKGTGIIEGICRDHYLEWLKQTARDGEDE